MGESVTDTLRNVKEADPVPPHLLNASVPRDLELICLKCLEKEPQRRYDSAKSLAQDLYCFLENRPIAARPPSRAHKLRKMVQRNKKTMAVLVAIVVFAATVNTLLVLSQLRERSARKTAEAHRLRADEKTAVLKSISALINADLLGPSSENLMAWAFEGPLGERAVINLNHAAASISNNFADDPLLEAKIRQALGDAYVRETSNTLAIPQYRRAYALRKQSLGPGDESTLHSMTTLGIALIQTRQTLEALSLNAEGLKLRKAKQGPCNDEAVLFLVAVADAYDKAGYFKEAIQSHEELIALSQGTPTFAHICTPQLASLYERTDNSDKAEALLRQWMRDSELQRGSFSREHATSLNYLGAFLLRQKRYTEAELLLRRGLQIREASNPHISAIPVGKSNLGAALVGQRKFEDAETLLLEAYSGLQKYQEQNPTDSAAKLHETVEHLVELYGLWSKTDKADKWRDILASLPKKQSRPAME